MAESLPIINTALIAKFLAGEASAEEAMLIEDWLTVPENRLEFERLSSLWNPAVNNVSQLSASRQDEWNKLDSKLSNTIFMPKRWPVYRLAVAAVLLVLLVPLAWLFFRTPRKSPSSEKATARQVHANDSNVRDSLPDGSFVAVRKGSMIKYAEDSTKQQRILQLNGEAYFSVLHNAKKPFVVEIDGLRITVIGTVFNVHKDSIDKDVEVQVVQGKVLLATASRELIVAKGQSGIYRFKSQELFLKDSLEINQFSYATKNFVFNNQSLKQVLEILQQAYEFRMDSLPSAMEDCRITANFNDRPLSYILQVVSTTLQIRCDLQNNTVTISGNGCN